VGEKQDNKFKFALLANTEPLPSSILTVRRHKNARAPLNYLK